MVCLFFLPPNVTERDAVCAAGMSAWPVLPSLPLQNHPGDTPGSQFTVGTFGSGILAKEKPSAFKAQRFPRLIQKCKWKDSDECWR